MKGDYEDFNALRRRKNKANSKPNKLVLSNVEWSQSAGRGEKSMCRQEVASGLVDAAPAVKR